MSARTAAGCRRAGANSVWAWPMASGYDWALACGKGAVDAGDARGTVLGVCRWG
jgi:hypothetical protein